MKKFLSILLAAMMVLAMTAAYADFTITVPPSETGVAHTYEVYQIFTGDLSTDGTILSNVKWGKNAAAAYKEGDKVEDTVLTTLTGTTGSDKAKLAVIGSYVNLNSTPFATVADGKSVNVPAGYYLIKDVNNSLDDKHDAYTTYIVEVCNSITLEPKAVFPTVDKEVQDETGDAEANDKDGWKETADHDLFESFSFRLTAKLPADARYADYTTYAVTFHDTMSEGITFEEIVSVTVDGQPLTAGQYTTTGTDNLAYGGTWTLKIEDLKTINNVNLVDDADVVVVYKAHLNEKAQIDNASVTSTTNENSVYLTYSNNPNVDGEGKTPTDYVWVFTYEVKNTKYANVAEAGKELAGAGFTLYDASGNVIPLCKIGDDYFVYPGPSTDAEGNTVTNLPTGATAVEKYEMITVAGGKFNIKGLDHGTYKLVETTVPNGYNKLDDFTINISAVHAENGDAAHASNTLNTASTMNNKLVNKSGATLPETGGIGTTLFYLIGGLMAAGSALTLVIRRRADADEE